MTPLKKKLKQKDAIFNCERKLKLPKPEKQYDWVPQSKDNSCKLPGTKVIGSMVSAILHKLLLTEFPQTNSFLLRNAKIYQGHRRVTQKFIQQHLNFEY